MLFFQINPVSALTEEYFDIIIEENQHLQEAINNASIGDNIYIKKGIYHEPLIINKSINLVGEDKNIVILDGDGKLYAIKVMASNISISGFTIKNSKIGIYQSDPLIKNNLFFGNLISNNNEGIRIMNSSDNIIQDNVFSKNSGSAIVFYDSVDNDIQGNIFFKNNKAINFGRWANINNISNNLFFQNAFSVYFSYSYNNTCSSNTISYGAYGFYLPNSKGNIIANNSIENMEVSAIYYDNDIDNIIYENIFNNNGINFQQNTSPPTIQAPGFNILIVLIAFLLIFIFRKKFNFV